MGRMKLLDCCSSLAGSTRLPSARRVNCKRRKGYNAVMLVLKDVSSDKTRFLMVVLAEWELVACVDLESCGCSVGIITIGKKVLSTPIGKRTCIAYSDSSCLCMSI